jgi:hypothetical protein
MKAGPLGAAGVEPPSHARGDGEEEHEDGEKDFTKISVWTPEAEKARSELKGELETGLEEEKEEHEAEITGMVADVSAVSEAGPELPGVSFEFAIFTVLTSDGRRLSEEVITVRQRLSPCHRALRRESHPCFHDDGEDEKNKEEEDGQADEEVETACSFSLFERSFHEGSSKRLESPGDSSDSSVVGLPLYRDCSRPLDFGQRVN